MIQNYRYYIALLIAVIIVWAAFYFFTDIVSYLLIAWVLSLIGQPFMRFFKGIHIGKFKINESIAAILTLICFAFIATGLVAAFVPLLVQQINELAKVDYAALQVSLSEPISKIDAWAHKYGMLTSNQNLIDEATNALKKWFDPSMFGDVFRTTLSTLSNLFVTIGSVTFITFFFFEGRQDVSQPAVGTRTYTIRAASASCRFRNQPNVNEILRRAAHTSIYLFYHHCIRFNFLGHPECATHWVIGRVVQHHTIYRSNNWGNHGLPHRTHFQPAS